MEVGCDVGYLLEAARKDGFRQIYGCEPNPLARKRGPRYPGNYDIRLLSQNSGSYPVTISTHLP